MKQVAALGGGRSLWFQIITDAMQRPVSVAQETQCTCLGSGIIDCLTVAVGNVHGNYTGTPSGTPSLDWQRLGEIRNLVQAPLCLHGASGLPDDDLRRAISTSVAKTNVNTELTAVYFRCLERELGPFSNSLDLKHLGDRLAEAVTVVEAKLEAFGRTAGDR